MKTCAFFSILQNTVHISINNFINWEQNSVLVNMFSLGELSLTLRCWTHYWTCYIFAIISPMKRAGSFICTNTNPLFPSMRSSKFGWNWPRGSWRDDFLNFVNAISLLSLLEKSRALHLNKRERKDALYQVVQLAHWFWWRWKCENCTDRRTDDRRSEKLTWGFSSAELKGVIFTD